MKKGAFVTVLQSSHSDVVPGQQGKIISALQEGYSVEIIGMFTDAFGKRIFEKRCLYFEQHQIVQSDELNRPLEYGGS
jgi:hypothetical protein